MVAKVSVKNTISYSCQNTFSAIPSNSNINYFNLIETSAKSMS